MKSTKDWKIIENYFTRKIVIKSRFFEEGEKLRCYSKDE